MMQDLLSELQSKYQQLLEDHAFQQQTGAWFNRLLHNFPLPAPPCARDLIYQHDRICLYHYAPLQPQKKSVPLLIVYAMVNRPSILDLQADRSFIRELLSNNIDVYLLDWGSTTPEDQDNDLSKYITHYLAKAVNTICKKTAHKKIDLLGICQGGVFSACYAALYPTKIRTLTTMVTPIDFHVENSVLTQWLQHIDTHTLVHKTGNIPGQWLAYGLQSLRPFRLWQDKYLSVLKNPNTTPEDLAFFLRMEQWINDCPDHPGKAFHEFIYYFYQCNALIKNQLMLRKKWVDLSRLTMPILNIYAEQDHLIPAASSRALSEYVGTCDYQEIGFSGGHIGVFVSQKALKTLPRAITSWLKSF